MLLSSDPAEVARGRRALQGLESPATAADLKTLTDLNEGAENAATVHQVIMISTMVIAAIGIAEVAPIIGLGARGLTALLPLELGTQRLLATGLTYVATGGLMTGANREITGIMMPQEAEQGSFLVEWIANTALMGVGTGAMRLGRAAFDAGLEFMAARNIAARTGTALMAPGLATGAEATALEVEKQTIMRGLLARFGQQATMFGAEYAAIQAF
jgi:hypothetical protein